MSKNEAPDQPDKGTAVVAIPQAQPPSLLAKIAAKYSIEPNKMLATLKGTAFKGGPNKEITNEQMVALLVVADQYQLNPFTKELFAFPDQSGIVPVVGVDGWTRIMNEHPQYDGYEIKFSEDTIKAGEKAVPVWCEVTMYRKDRSRPTVHREWFDEVRRDTAPWRSHPRRMLKHKTVIQAARSCFGFAGIYDQDEAERIVDVSASVAPAAPLPEALEQLNTQAAARASADVTDVEVIPASNDAGNAADVGGAASGG